MICRETSKKHRKLYRKYGTTMPNLMMVVKMKTVKRLQELSGSILGPTLPCLQVVLVVMKGGVLLCYYYYTTPSNAKVEKYKLNILTYEMKHELTIIGQIDCSAQFSLDWESAYHTSVADNFWFIAPMKFVLLQTDANTPFRVSSTQLPHLQEVKERSSPSAAIPSQSVCTSADEWWCLLPPSLQTFKLVFAIFDKFPLLYSVCRWHNNTYNKSHILYLGVPCLMFKNMLSYL